MRSRVQVKTGMKKTAISIRSSFLSVLHSGVKKYNATNAAASVASAPKNIDRAKFGFRLMSMALRVKCGPSLLHVRDVEFANVYKMSRKCGRRRHHRADEVRAAVAALAAFKIAIRRAGAALVRRQYVGVHADAHAAARIAPLETGVGENFVEAFFFRGGFDSARAGNDERLLDGLRDVLSFDEVRGGAQIVEPRIGARTDEDAVHGNIRDRRAGFEPHVFQSAFGGFLIVQILEVVRIGHARVHAGDHAGIRPPRNLRRDLFGLQLDGHVKLCAIVGMQLLPTRNGFLEFFSARNERTPFKILKRCVVRRHHSGARAAFNRHIADAHAAFHGKFANGLPAVFRNVAGAAADADFSDDGENDVFRGHAFRTFSVHENVHHFGFRLHEALCREHVFHFARANAESERAEGAVRGSVAVAADDRVAGLRDAEFGADDVHDALIFAVHIEQANAGFAAIFFEGFKLEAGVGVNNREGAVLGGDGVIHYGESEIGAAYFAAFRFESGEGLRRSAFVDEVAVNIDERGFPRLLMDEMRVPDFFVEGFQ